MICSKCGHDNVQKPHSLDPWCMYQVKDGVVINAMFLPDRIPKGWYDSPKAAKQALIDPTEMFREKAMHILGERQSDANKENTRKILEKIDGRTKAGRKLKAKVDDHCTGTN